MIVAIPTIVFILAFIFVVVIVITAAAAIIITVIVAIIFVNAVVGVYIIIIVVAVIGMHGSSSIDNRAVACGIVIILGLCIIGRRRVVVVKHGVVWFLTVVSFIHFDFGNGVERYM